MASIDTLAAAKELRAAGFDSDKAEALARTVGKLESEHFASKTDLAGLRAELKSDLYRVALGIIGANAAITLGIVRFLN